jgi:hypothetical protein
MKFLNTNFLHNVLNFLIVAVSHESRIAIPRRICKLRPRALTPQAAALHLPLP